MLKLDAVFARYDANLEAMFDKINTWLSNRCTSAAGLAIGSSSKAKVKIVNTTTFLSGGIFKSKSTAEVVFTATTHDIAAHATLVQEAMYLLTLAADGTPTLTMGAIVSGAGNAVLPELPATGTPIGAVRIAIAAGATPFDASTDELDAAHITDTYYDYGWITPHFDAVQ
jgi:hypothetical protein